MCYCGNPLGEDPEGSFRIKRIENGNAYGSWTFYCSKGCKFNAPDRIGATNETADDATHQNG
jgi:hypothetical protein